MSEKNLVDYVIALAKRSRDEPSFLVSLRENGIAMTDDSRRFAVQLMKKVPRAQSDNKGAEQAALLKKQEKERQQKQIDLLKKNSEYTMLEDDEADLAAAAAAVEAKRLQKLERKEEKREAKKEKKESKRHLRKKSKWSEDEEDEGAHAGGDADQPAAKKAKLEDDDGDDALEDWELEELERVRDRSFTGTAAKGPWNTDRSPSASACCGCRRPCTRPRPPASHPLPVVTYTGGSPGAR
jgi:hypothetical protein